MSKTGNNKLTPFSQSLRREMTKEERHLWYDFLKLLPITVNRQKVIGRYILDFYCAASKIAIELDGSQHYENENILADKERDEYLAELGIIVLRYSNFELSESFEGVCEDILNHILNRSEN